MSPLEFRMLGPLDAVEDDRPLALGGAKQRGLLAVLLLHANQAVSSDRLIDQLWGESPPATAGKIVQVYVSRLRKQLGEARLLTRPPGYLLRVDPEELDLARFERLVAEAREEDAAAAGAKLRVALALWRGPPLADLAYERFAQAEIVRLEELRWAALELRIDADLAAARHRELVGELEALIAEHPLRERLRCQLMLALYRSGRQAEALDVYRHARRELSEQLGLEPGEELKRLERAVLSQDRALALAEEEPRPSVVGATSAPDRSLLIAARGLDGVGALAALAAPLAASSPSRELVIAAVVETGEVGAATAALAERRAALLADRLVVRTVAFSSPSWGRDVVRLASRETVDLLLVEAPRAGFGGD